MVKPEPSAETSPDVRAEPALLTLEELTARVGLSVRNVRFYTSKGLVPPPIRRGRSGYYTADHVARLELVKDLQRHGFTLSAIEGYLAAIPADASAEDLALHRTMLSPWQGETTVEMSRTELGRRAGRELSDDELATLAALGVAIRNKRGRYQVSTTQLAVGVGLIDLGFPTEAAVAAADVYTAHGRQLAKELNDVFRTMVWPAYREAGASPETIREMVERLKPLSIASLVAAYEAAMDESRRERIAARSRGRD